jgi:8-oxo-dGTP pyrophosphatase MutT (NUDIX family)
MIDKVTCFILRRRDLGFEYLVLQHPTVGLCLPAGTVDVGETPEIAAIREIHGETGLHDVQLIRKLGEEQIFLPQELAVIEKSSRLYTWPAFSGQLSGSLLKRGFPVNVAERKVGFTKITYAESDIKTKPPKEIITVSGWIPDGYLTRQITRHYYLFEVSKPAQDAWSWKTNADENYTFRCSWAKLDSPPQLSAEQAGWLHYLDDLTI